MLLLAARLDCGRSSPDNGSAECAERADAGIGVLVVVVVVAVVVGYLLSRHRARTDATAEPVTEEERERALRALEAEYEARLADGDADTREASRDWHDWWGTPWRMEVFVAAAFLVLLASMLVLIPVFAVLGALTD